MYKADLHMHSKEDWQDDMLSYSVYELIDYLAKLNYEVISITFHNQLYYQEKIINYARKKGILLIPGVELLVQNSHILVYNAKPDELKKIKTFSDLEKIKRTDTLIIAAHPFFGLSSAGKNIDKYPNSFDGVEHSGFYLPWFNRNKKAAKYIKKHNYIIMGNSDAHFLKQIDTNYSLLPTKKDIPSIFKAIKENKHKLVTRPLKFKTFLEISFWLLSGILTYRLKIVKTFHDRTRDGS